MSTSSEITRLQTARNTIRNKLVNLGLAESTDKLDVLATAISQIDNNGAIDAQVKEGESYTIPEGYHNGSGTVKGVSGGGNYSLQAKEVTPTTAQQSVTPSSGYYGLSAVTVGPIPSNYKDVSSTTAAAGDVLANKVFIDSSGVTTTGTMVNNGAVSQALSASTKSYTIPAGYHNGSGTVSVSTESKTITPSTSSQEVLPATGKLLESVTVNPIPENYGDASNATAVAGDILDGKVAITLNGDNEAVEITGTMVDRGTVTAVLDATTGNQVRNLAAGKYGTSSVSIVLEEKSVTPSTSAQNITPTTGKVLSKVAVAAIPSNYGNATGANATAANILTGKKAVVMVGGTATLVDGSMNDNGALTATIDGTTTTSYTIPAGYHNGSGTVSLDDTIETALAAI